MADGGEGIDLELDPTGGTDPSRPGRRGRVVALLGLVALVTLGVVAVMNGADDERADTDDVPAPEDDPAPTVETDDPAPPDAVDAAGRYDGLDSIRLPLEVTPDSDLTDGMIVAARGAGYTPRASVGIIQCASIDDGNGSIDNCDLSNYLLGHADDEGYVDMALPVRRFIATGDGEIDCALLTVSCSVAIGNISDYDESGTAPIWFDANVDGVRSPVITVSPSSGLRDGDTITVTGENFQPDGTVDLSQCVIGGPYGFGSCFSQDLITDSVVVGADGTFVAEVQARRHPMRDIDCFDDVYGCRLAAQGPSDAPNPVALSFDGSVRPADGVGLTLEPGGGFVDGSEIVVSVEEVPVDGDLVVRQCVDQGTLGVTCAPDVAITVTDGSGSGAYVLRRFMINAAGDTVDCAVDGRVCELRVEGVHEQTVPLRFEEVS